MNRTPNNPAQNSQHLEVKKADHKHLDAVETKSEASRHSNRSKGSKAVKEKSKGEDDLERGSTIIDMKSIGGKLIQ